MLSKNRSHGCNFSCYITYMEVKHQFGEDMTIVLDQHDLGRLRMGGTCESAVDADGDAVLGTVIERDEHTREPIAEVDVAGAVRVSLPMGRLTLPISVPVANRSGTNFYFGEKGQINLQGEVEI